MKLSEYIFCSDEFLKHR